MSRVRTTVRIEQLLGDARCGDADVRKAALFELVGLAHERVMCLVQRCLGPRGRGGLRNHMESDDVLQDAAVDALTSIRNGLNQVPASPGQFFAFIGRILRNNLSDLRDRFGQEGRQVFEPTADRPAPAPRTALDDLIDLAAAMETLTEEEHDLFTERCVKGRSFEEIAGDLGVVRQTLHHRWHGMLEKLSRHMDLTSAAG